MDTHTANRFTVTERFSNDGATVTWTARVGRNVAVKVDAPREHGMYDTAVLRYAIAKHTGVDVDNVRAVRARNEPSVAPRVWEVDRPEADTLPVAEETPEEHPAAALLGDGEHWVKHLRVFGRDPKTEPATRAQALDLITWAQGEGWQCYRATAGGVNLENTTGESSYWLEPSTEATGTPAPRPAAEVLATDPIPAGTSVWAGMPGEPTGPGGVSLVDALTAEAYAVQIRSTRVWVLPNHDDGAHMTRAQVISAVARVRRNSADHVRSTVDTDGTLYLSNGHQAARYIPVTLFTDYSADHCPGCGTPYASNGDGPCPGRPAEEPARRSMTGIPDACKTAEAIAAEYTAEAAALLGDGARFMRHRRAEEDAASVPVDRAEALALVVKALRDDWTVGPHPDGGLGLVTPGTATYLLVPMPCPGCGAAPGEPCRDALLDLLADAPQEQHDRAEEIRQEVTAEAEQRPCPGCGAEPGEPCEPMSQCDAAREQVVAERLAEEGHAALPFRTVIRDTTAREFDPLDLKVYCCERCGDPSYLARDWNDAQVPALCVGCHDQGNTEQASDGHQCEDWCGLGTDHDGLCAPGPDGDEEPEEIDDMGTDDLLTVLREEAPNLPADDRFARAWAAMDRILTDGGIQCLPAPWDGYGSAPAPFLKREPWRGGQICGHQTTYGMGAYSERYCGTRKAPGEVECAEHARDTREQYGPRATRQAIASGNAVGDPSTPLELFWEPYGGEEPITPTDEERTAYADTVASLEARFMPQDPGEEGTRPCVTLPTGEQVYVYREGGRLVVRVDLDGCDSTVNDGVVPMVVQVQGREVFEG